MTLRKRIWAGVAVVVLAAFASLAIAVSYNAPCRDPAPPAVEAPRMNAVVYRCYGPPEVLKIEELAVPTPQDDEVLVRVRAAGVNPLEWHKVRGEPYFLRLSGGLGSPTGSRIGTDFSGVVTAVGHRVTRFSPGDEVFGGARGAWAHYVVVREDGAIAPKPATLTFEQAASVPVAAVTALQALRDKGRLGPGQKVLINGASGGVGTFAVQIAKSMGAEVTGVCSTRNLELVSSLGADRVIDYTRENFTQMEHRYDVILDNVGSQGILALRRVLKPGGIIVIVGATSKDPWLGPMTGPIAAEVIAPFVDEEMSMFVARTNQQDLGVLAALLRDAKVRPVIDRTYPFTEAAQALAYVEAGRTRGKVVIRMDSSSAD